MRFSNEIFFSFSPCELIGGLRSSSTYVIESSRFFAFDRKKQINGVSICYIEREKSLFTFSLYSFEKFCPHRPNNIIKISFSEQSVTSAVLKNFVRRSKSELAINFAPKFSRNFLDYIISENEDVLILYVFVRFEVLSVI